jgi:hypothetical protein
MKHIVDSNGFYVGFGGAKTEIQEGQSEVPFAPPAYLIKAKWDGEKWIEGATEKDMLAKESEIIAERKRQQHAELLKTDWYVVRFAETGVPIPQEVIELRNQIRNKYESI